MLSEEEEKMLLQNFIEKNEREAGQKVLIAHLRLVVKIAMEFKRFTNSLIDLIAEGNYGLMRALQKFSLEKNVRFSTYATIWIKACIQDFLLRAKSVIRIGKTALQKKILYNYSKSQNETEGSNVEQIAVDLGVNTRDVQEVKSLTNIGFIDGENEDVEGENLEKKFLYSNIFTKDKIEQALNSLDETEKFVIEKRILLEEPSKLSCLAASLGLSTERVRQIQQKAVEKLKKNLNKKDFYV
jgi:RNA polymerase sigma-32 factor